MDGSRTILSESGLNKKFWPEAILSFVHVWNRVCHHGQKKTPIELYTGTKPSVRHLRKFGSTVYVGVPKQHRGKLDPKARKGVLVGYALGTKGYRIWLPESEKVIESCDVSFPKTEEGISGAVLAPENDYQLGDEQGANDESECDEIEEPLPTQPSHPTSILKSRKSSVESSDSESEEDENKALEETTWIRKVVPRKLGNRNDIYYYEKNKDRLRSKNDVEGYCREKNLKYDESLFDFSSKNLYEGEVPKPSSSHVQCCTCSKS